MLKFYNTASRRKEVFKPSGTFVTAYTCGLTVYGKPHIGNWRTFIFYDTLIRVLKCHGYDVRHVQNITDVGHLVSDDDEGEDKLDKQAKLERKTAWEVAEEYTTDYLQCNQKLNMLTPYRMPKATQHIAEQIKMVQMLEDKGLTYQIDDGVYFDTGKWPEYGKKLLGKNAKADKQFARINSSNDKRNPEDFALWKLSIEGQQRDMEWDSPWGRGFPGWHLECSAMAKKYLGDTIDIHAGGIDHIPIHHTNEIAQSEAANDAEFARWWMHGEFILVDGRKMSKSLKNVYTLEDVQQQGYSPLDFRMMVLQGHYRTETNFSWDNMRSAHNRLAGLYRLAELRWSLKGRVSDTDTTSTIAEISQAIQESLSDDLNTPQALMYLSKLSNMSAQLDERSAQAFTQTLQLADKALGLNLLKQTPDISDAHKQAIKQREAAKEQKDYIQADEIRDTLGDDGIELLDSVHGVMWQRNR